VAAECGGLCAKATDAQLKALRQYGYNLGVSFQIRDDILDFYGDEAKFGKRIGQDLYERKLGNILLIYALEELGEKEGKGLLDVFKKKNITDGDVNKALTLIKSTRAKEKATELATQYNDQGLESLKNLPKNEYSGILKDFLEFVSVREV
jgi:geranylgeranyl pyrophosphate synthase